MSCPQNCGLFQTQIMWLFDVGGVAQGGSAGQGSLLQQRQQQKQQPDDGGGEWKEVRTKSNRRKGRH